MNDFEVMDSRSTGRAKYAHEMTYAEMASSKVAVMNQQGIMIGGPDRKMVDEWSKWVQWQKAIQHASRELGAVPPHVMDYFQATKHLTRPPKAGDPNIAQTGAIDANLIVVEELDLAKPKRFTWSYTALQEFLTCPAQYAAKRYYKTIVETQTDAMRAGEMLHETAEHYGKKLLGLPYSPLAIHTQYLPMVQRYVDAIVASGAEIHFEKEMCFDNKMQLSHWKAWDTVWVRSKADVLVKNKQKLSIIDWKTGKYKEDFLQLRMFAVFAALTPGFEDVQEFDPKFIFTKESGAKAILRLPTPILRTELRASLAEILAMVRRMEAAWETENFPAKKNGLCRKYCPNKACPHCG